VLTSNDALPRISDHLLARLRGTSLPPSAKLAALLLAARADATGRVRCTDQQLAALVGCSQATAHDARRALTDGGHAVVTRDSVGRGGGSVYDLGPLLGFARSI
jgi:hypothetical protein